MIRLTTAYFNLLKKSANYYITGIKNPLVLSDNEVEPILPESEQKELEISAKSTLQLKELANNRQNQLGIQFLVNRLQIYGGNQDYQTLQDGTESFVKYCQILDEKLEEGHYLNLEQIILLRNILFRIDASDQIDAQSIYFQNLFKCFGVNFQNAYRNGRIKFEETAKSIEQFIKFYGLYTRKFPSYPSNNFFKEMMIQMQEIFNKQTRKTLSKINPRVLIVLLEQIFTREIFTGQKIICQKIFDIFSWVDTKKILTNLDKFKVVLLANKALFCGVQKTKCIIFWANNIVLIKKQKKIEKDILIYFIKNTNTIQYSQMENLYLACNIFVQSFNIKSMNQLQNLKKFFEGLLAMASNRRTSNILSNQNKLKLTEVLTNFIKQTQDPKEPIFKLFLKVFQTKMISPEMVKQFLPFVVQNHKLHSQVSLIFEFAQRGHFHEAFFMGIPQQITNNFMNSSGERQQKALDIKLACIYNLYQKNLEKISNKSPTFYITHKAKLVSLQRNKVKITKKIEQLGNFNYFKQFVTNLSNNQTELASLHENYKQKYLPKLLNQLNQENTFTIVQYFLKVCKSNEILQEIQLVNQYINIQGLRILMKNIQSQKCSERCEINLTIFLSNYLSILKPNDKKSGFVLHRIVTLYSDPKMIQNISRQHISQLIELLRMLSGHSENFPEGKKRLIHLFSRYVLNFKFVSFADNREYMKFMTSLIEKKEDYFNLVFYCLTYNLITLECLQVIKKKSFGEYFLWSSLLLEVIQNNFSQAEPLKITNKMFWELLPVFKNKRITSKWLQQNQLNILSRIEVSLEFFLYKCLINFEIPRMPENYQLVFLTALISEITSKATLQNKCILSYALCSLDNLINNQSYKINPADNFPSESLKHHQRKQKFNEKMKLFLQKVTSLCLNRYFETILVTQINFQTHCSILNLCSNFNVIPKEYLRKLLDYCNQTVMPPGEYCKIFMKVNRMCKIENKKYLEKLESDQFNQKVCQKYLIQLVGIASLTKNPSSFINKILKTQVQINELILKYIEVVYQSSLQIAETLYKPDNSLEIKFIENSPFFNKLKFFVGKQAKENGGTSSIVKIGKNMSFILSQFQGERNLHSILSTNLKKMPVSQMFYLEQILAIIFQVPQKNVYICSELQAQNIFQEKDKKKSQEKDEPLFTAKHQIQAGLRQFEAYSKLKTQRKLQ